MRGGSRLSPGGQAVEDSLAKAGFELRARGVSLVETAFPLPRTRVVVQNAWNVLSHEDFAELAAPYPERMRRRMTARRALAALNLAMAREVWCLTEAAAALVRRRSRQAASVRVSPVTVPLDVLRSEMTGTDPSVQGWAVVPGSITWYKRPELALRWVTETQEAVGVSGILFAGRDDGSGCWQHVRHLAEGLGVSVERRSLTRDQLYAALRGCVLAILPSRLETLGFGLGEALHVAPAVAASAIPSHLEVARRIGREPHWLESSTGELTWRPDLGTSRPPTSNVLDEWVTLGSALGLRSKRDRSATGGSSALGVGRA